MAIYGRGEWTAKRVETAIDPDRPIIDPHHHLWDREASTYLVADLLADTRASHNVTDTVFVECSAEYDATAPPHLAPVGETRFVAAQAAALEALGATRIGAIVSHADMTLGDQVAEVLAAHTEAGAGLFRGIRHGLNWSPFDDVKNGHHDPNQGQMGAANFRAGVATLGDMGFSFDAWLYFDQLGELAELAMAIPQTKIIVNHLGGPLGIGPHAGAGQAEMVAIWRAGIAAAAACDNVVLKVGGIGMGHYFGMESRGTPWADLDTPPDSETVANWWADRVHYCIDTFGPDRCMFESNFPVDRQTLPYTVLWNAFQILAARYSPAEQDALFHNTAKRAYRI